MRRWEALGGAGRRWERVGERVVVEVRRARRNKTKQSWAGGEGPHGLGREKGRGRDRRKEV